MLSPDPVKRNINPYPYCDNEPVNYNDPTGEIANILVGAGLGGFFGGAAGFLGNAAAQPIRLICPADWGMAEGTVAEQDTTAEQEALVSAAL